MKKHIVWDWNGTLFNDIEITAQYNIDCLKKAGRSGLSIEDIRHNHTRPLSEFFELLLGHPLSAEELAVFIDGYSEVYDPIMYDLPLQDDALQALDKIKAAGGSQSILSMAPHDELVSLVRHNGIYERFERVEGATNMAREFKVDALREHCDRLGVDPAQVCVIGDTIDDFDAATGVGASSVLVSTGMHTHERLVETGAPVATSLLGAVAEALK